MKKPEIKLIAEMKPGEEGYTLPWGFYPRALVTDRALLFVRGDYDVAMTSKPFGTLETHIRMSDDGIVELLDPVDSIDEHLTGNAPFHLDWKWIQVRPMKK